MVILSNKTRTWVARPPPPGGPGRGVAGRHVTRGPFLAHPPTSPFSSACLPRVDILVNWALYEPLHLLAALPKAEVASSHGFPF